MNMTNVLHRKSGTAHELSSTAAAPPRTATPSVPSSPWPRPARALVAILLVAAVVSTIAAIVGAGGPSDSDVARLEDRVATLTTERNDALLQAVDLDKQLTTIREELAAARAAGEEQAGRIEVLQAQLADVTEARDSAVATVADVTVERDEARAQLTALTGQVDQLTGQVADLKVDVGDLQQKLAKAIAERDAAKNVKPIKVDVSLAGVNMVGKYTVKVTDEVGTAPKFTQLTITTTKDGWLWMTVPGVGEGGLTMVDGSLQWLVSSTTAVPACNGVARQAQVIMTVSADGYSVSSSGVARTGIHGVLTVTAPASGSCGAVIAFANAQITKV